MFEDITIQIVILALILILPFISKKVEHNIEFFFLALGIFAVLFTGLLSFKLIEEALLHPVMIGGLPIGITQAVLLAGLFFYMIRERIDKIANKLVKSYILPLTIFGISFLSSVISAIVASAIFAELLGYAKINREAKVKITIVSAFAIGIGAVLFPLGEPLSTIVIAKLSREPYHAGFTFLFDNMWHIVIPLLLFFSVLSLFYIKDNNTETILISKNEYGIKDIFIRTLKVYIFVFALTLLGEFFKPLAEPVAKMGTEFLYFFGLISAAADNATLAAALVSGEMHLYEIKAFVASLTIAGGFLIPGNIPNIIFASILKIGFKEWAKIALPIGMPVFLVSGLLLLIFNL
jgi:predicted cation transporter